MRLVPTLMTRRIRWFVEGRRDAVVPALKPTF
jgi:hypothetical protein